MYAIRYVEQNPMRAKMVADPADYPWSSAAAHCSGYEDPWLDIESPPFTIPDWRQRLNTGSNGQADEFLRECTTTGRPCGDSAFVLRIEEKTNRDFTKKETEPQSERTAGTDIIALAGRSNLKLILAMAINSTSPEFPEFRK
jgi:putative transposase